MITPEQWTIIEKQANKLYSNLEDEIIKEIAERIANVGYANTVALNDVLILQEMGLLYENIIQKVAEENNASVSQIEEIFETAGVKSLEYDDNIYRMAGLSPRPLNQSASMWQLLGATSRKTHNNLSNLVMTTANTSQTQFYNAMNKAYMEVSTGVKSYSQSILDTIKDISEQGAYIEYPSGQHRSIESAVRTNILTSVNQTSGKLQEMRAEEMGWDLVEVSAHSGARPEHAEWQGKVYSLKGLTKGYKTLEEGCDYGSVTGLCGVNCRHTFFPFYKGSTRTYTNKELQELKNETVTYNGQKISKYDASQIQRKMERQIRQDKKDIAALQGVLTSGNKDDKLLEDTKTQLANAQTKLKQHNLILNNFTKQTGLKKDYNRLAIGSSKKNVKTNNNIRQWKKFTTMDEAKEYVYNNYKDSDIDKIKNVEAMNVTFDTLDELQSKYPLNNEIFVRNKTISNAAANGNYQGININTSHFNKASRKALVGDDWIEDLNKQIEDLKQYLGNMKYKQKPIENGIRRLEQQKKFKCYSISGSYADLESIKATIAHEYGHVIADQYFGQINKFKANKNFDYFDSNECWQKCRDVASIYNEALRNNDIYDISYYASTDQYEFFAECFAKKQMGGILPDYINEMLERALKNGK